MRIRDSEVPKSFMTGMSRAISKLSAAHAAARLIRARAYRLQSIKPAFREAREMFRPGSCGFRECLLLLLGCSGSCACYSGLASLHNRELVFSNIGGDLILMIEYLPKIEYDGDMMREE